MNLRSAAPARARHEEACARQILGSLARRAYRRPVTAADLAPLLKLFADGRADGKSFDSGIEMALTGILVSPDFLFRVGSTHRPASPRKSAIWNWPRACPFSSGAAFRTKNCCTPPKPANSAIRPILATQVRRMLADPKSQALEENFAGQWLHLRNVAAWKPDPRKVSAVRRSAPQRLRARKRSLLLEHHARRPQRAGIHRRRLHVPERTPRPPLRRARRQRQLLPQGAILQRPSIAAAC